MSQLSSTEDESREREDSPERRKARKPKVDFNVHSINESHSVNLINNFITVNLYSHMILRDNSFHYSKSSRIVTRFSVIVNTYFTLLGRKQSKCILFTQRTENNKP